MPLVSDSSYLNGAVLSPDGLYRYRLTRRLTGSLFDTRDWFKEFNEREHLVCWILLNPSTADAEVNDATVRKIMGFSRRWGYRVAGVYNLFAFRATHQRDLWQAVDPVGPENDDYLKLIPSNVTTVAAWGNGAYDSHTSINDTRVFLERSRAVKKMLASRRAVCLGFTEAMHEPRHPVRLGYDTQLEAFA